jgi:hypothetical protein
MGRCRGGQGCDGACGQQYLTTFEHEIFLPLIGRGFQPSSRPCLTIAQIFRPCSEATWRVPAACCQSDEGRAAGPRRAQQPRVAGGDREPNSGAMIPLSLAANRSSAALARVVRHRIRLSRYLYDCTNKMVLSTKKRLGLAKPGPQDGPKSIILKGLDCNL